MVKYKILGCLQCILSRSTCTSFELFTSQEQPKCITITILKQNDSSDELSDGQAERHFKTP